MSCLFFLAIRANTVKMKKLRHDSGLESCYPDFDSLRAGVYAFAMSVLHRRELAEDVTQETLLRLFVCLAQGDDIQNHKGWAVRVCRNVAFNRIRRDRIAPFERSAQVDDLINLLATGDPDPEQRLLERERTRQIGMSLDLLTRHQRACVLLRARGLRYREIAARLNITTSSAVEALARAIERLRASLVAGAGDHA